MSVNVKNEHRKYIPVHTADGHASFHIGTTPENHGIIPNNWYDKYLKKVFTVQMIALPQHLVMPGSKGTKSSFRRHIKVGATARTMQTSKIY
jgi:predicted AlkP superfamily pyrophosphatase or phosphodiesterase|tara:strand:- start:2594 stop:2869 length:276 start_codon:yes stop_codon:yes gene_type:complete